MERTKFSSVCDIINLRLDALEVEILPGTFFSEAAKVAFPGYLFSRTVKNIRIEVTEKCFHQKLVVQINFYYTPVAKQTIFPNNILTPNNK